MLQLQRNRRQHRLKPWIHYVYIHTYIYIHIHMYIYVYVYMYMDVAKFIIIYLNMI